MEVILALVILLLLIITIGFLVILPVGPLKRLLTTIIEDVHSTYKLGITYKNQLPSGTHDKVATRPLYYQPLKHQYKDEHNDDTGTDDTDIADNKSSFESSSWEKMKKDRNAKKISVRKNETKDCNKSPLATSSFKWPSMLSSLPSPPPSLSPPPSPLPILPPPPPLTSTAKEVIITSSDENIETRSKPKSKKKRGKRNSTSQPQSLPTKCQKKPSVDIPYSSLPDDIKVKHPDHQKSLPDNPESTGVPVATVKTVPREARGAISLPHNIPPLSCPLPPVITVQSSGNQSIQSTVSPPPLPIPHHGHIPLQSSNSVPPPVLPSVPPVVIRAPSVSDANNEEGGIVKEFDLLRFENENTRAIENERDIDDNDDDDDDARVPSGLQLPEIVTEHVPVQSSTDAPPLLDNAWETQQLVDVNMEPQTDELVIAPLVLHFPQELQNEAELVLPDLEPFKEPESFIDSGDDIY